MLSWQGGRHKKDNKGTARQVRCALVNRLTHSETYTLSAVLYSPFNNISNLGTRLNNCVGKTALSAGILTFYGVVLQILQYI